MSANPLYVYTLFVQIFYLNLVDRPIIFTFCRTSLFKVHTFLKRHIYNINRWKINEGENSVCRYVGMLFGPQAFDVFKLLVVNSSSEQVTCLYAIIIWILQK